MTDETRQYPKRPWWKPAECYEEPLNFADVAYPLIAALAFLIVGARLTLGRWPWA